MPEFHFVDSRPRPSRTLRERQLHMQSIRSHVAIVGHKGKQARESKVRDHDKPARKGQRPSILTLQRHESSTTSSTDDAIVGDVENVASTESSNHVCAATIEDQVCTSPSTRKDSYTRSICSPEYFGAVPWWASESVDYFTQANVPFHCTIHEIFNVTNVMTDFFVHALKHDASSQAAIAYHMVVLDRARRPNQKLSTAALTRMTEAISGMRQHLAQLQGSPGHCEILSILCLSIAARIVGDTDALIMHNNTIKQFLSCLGGIHALEPGSVLHVFLLQWESAWNSHAGSDEDSLFPEARPPPFLSYSPTPPGYQNLISILPAGFRRLQSKLSLSALEGLARVAHRANSGSTTDLPYFNRCYRDFWEAFPCLRPQESPDESLKLERSIVQALLLYCFCTFPEKRVSSIAFTGLRRDLGATIRNRPGMDDDERAALIWCWMCLIDSWMDASGDLLPEGLLLVTKMKQAFPRLTHVDQVLAQLSLFFTNEDFERRCSTYWNADCNAEDSSTT